MKCPHCNGSNTQRHGSTKAGNPRYRCLDCLTPKGKPRTFTISDKGHGGARRGVPGQPMTNAETQRAYRKRHGLTGNEARDKRKRDRD